MCRRNVTDIQIETSILLEIPSQLFIKHQNIEYFNIIENIGLRSIGGPFIFRHSKKLIGFRVMRNNITVIKNRTFFGAIFLHSLYLNDNHIVYLEPRAFEGLENLYMLFLESNKIKTLDSNLFRSLKRINHILLNQNQIRKIRDFVFPKNSELRRIELHRNKIKIIEEGALKNISTLETLDLGRNKLREFNEISENLITLDLRNNKLKTLRIEGVVETIVLSNNEISEIIVKSNQIKSLDLRNNFYSNLNNLTLLFNLEQLKLSNNQIGPVHSNIFVNFAKLKVLLLKRTNVTGLTESSFQGLNYLKRLDLSENDLKPVNFPKKIKNVLF